ncbi:hypothetical protein K1T71_007517 [Dendrolimus kikuchii]|uniref:Uncharacterized protein n=1 Tax=Dendrolimus kikuchii TaxID=765133 RepID=A0ACC1D1Q7_9NEOP|nr:hypothetical protein K1T71_007517 [Dendrolimus kikuchii]
MKHHQCIQFDCTLHTRRCSSNKLDRKWRWREASEINHQIFAPGYSYDGDTVSKQRKRTDGRTIHWGENAFPQCPSGPELPTKTRTVPSLFVARLWGPYIVLAMGPLTCESMVTGMGWTDFISTSVARFTPPR